MIFQCDFKYLVRKVRIQEFQFHEYQVFQELQFQMLQVFHV